ncbi:MAG TPA: hypothetical protein VN457_00015 [Chlamydiales bacterium]|nr:hypothetical protein [Chlamydiales bacterium]
MSKPPVKTETKSKIASSSSVPKKVASAISQDTEEAEDAEEEAPDVADSDTDNGQVQEEDVTSADQENTKAYIPRSPEYHPSEEENVVPEVKKRSEKKATSEKSTKQPKKPRKAPEETTKPTPSKAPRAMKTETAAETTLSNKRPTPAASESNTATKRPRVEDGGSSAKAPPPTIVKKQTVPPAPVSEVSEPQSPKAPRQPRKRISQGGNNKKSPPQEENGDDGTEQTATEFTLEEAPPVKPKTQPGRPKGSKNTNPSTPKPSIVKTDGGTKKAQSTNTPAKTSVVKTKELVVAVEQDEADDKEILCTEDGHAIMEKVLANDNKNVMLIYNEEKAKKAYFEKLFSHVEHLGTPATQSRQMRSLLAQAKKAIERLDDVIMLVGTSRAVYEVNEATLRLERSLSSS